MNEIERAREKIIELAKLFRDGDCLYQDGSYPCGVGRRPAVKLKYKLPLGQPNCDKCFGDAILAIPSLCVKADDQRLPTISKRWDEFIEHDWVELSLTEKDLAKGVMRKMLTNNFVRIIRG